MPSSSLLDPPNACLHLQAMPAPALRLHAEHARHSSQLQSSCQLMAHQAGMKSLYVCRSPGGAWKLAAMGLAGLATLKMCGGFAQHGLGLRPHTDGYGRSGPSHVGRTKLKPQMWTTLACVVWSGILHVRARLGNQQALMKQSLAECP